ncbi:MAG: DUF2953 domain-containing protein [Oscillospiraceae bacterium]|jgi:hypothetical protein|nr:DUF2953 domain-containing protein [Oscillospiraceae bacterium]
MIALIILGAVLLLIAVLMSLPLVFVIDYEKEAEIKIRLLFFNLFEEKEPKKQKRRKRAKKKLVKYKKAKAAHMQRTNDITTAPNAKKEKSIVKDIPDLDIKMLKMLIGGMAHPIKRLIRKIKITELSINSVVGGSDAAKTAINYGLQNAAVHSAVAWVGSISNVKVENINIQADFMREDSKLALHCKVKIKSGTVLICLLAFMFRIASLNGNGNGNHKKPQYQSRSGGIGKTIRIVMD